MKNWIFELVSVEDVNFIVNDILQYFLHSFINQLSQKLSVVI